MDGWSVRQLLSYRRLLKQSGADIYHVQYPSVGYGRSLLPALTGWLMGTARCVVTLHEYEVFRPYRRPWFSPYQHFAARIFSRTGERDAYATRFIHRQGQDQIIPIGSNMPVSDKGLERASGSVAFFGLFWPGKGIEEFISFARDLRQQHSDMRKISIIGAPVAGQEDFHAEIKAACEAYQIDLHENLPAEDVADRLSEHEFTYLPFPEGADERRGSLAAGLVNGCLPITKFGEGTPDWMRQTFLEANTPEDAVALLTGDKVTADELAAKKAACQTEAGRYDWPMIANRHIELYRDLLGLAG